MLNRVEMENRIKLVEARLDRLEKAVEGQNKKIDKILMVTDRLLRLYEQPEQG